MQIPIGVGVGPPLEPEEDGCIIGKTQRSYGQPDDGETMGPLHISRAWGLEAQYHKHSSYDCAPSPRHAVPGSLVEPRRHCWLLGLVLTLVLLLLVPLERTGQRPVGPPVHRGKVALGDTALGATVSYVGVCDDLQTVGMGGGGSV